MTDDFDQLIAGIDNPHRIAPDVDRQEWLTARKAGITATDIAAIVGLHPYKTALQVWQDKVTVELTDDDLSELEAVEWGTRLEPMVADKFADKHPEWQVLPSPGLIAGPQVWQLATPDRMLVASRTHVPAPLELKTVGARSAWRWDNDDVPDEHALQLQWQMLVTGSEVGWLAALIAGQRYVEHRFDADHELWAILTAKAVEFRERHIDAGVPPIADPWRDAQLLNHIYQVEAGKTVELSGESRIALAHLAGIKAHIKELEAQQAECEATIKQDLGEAEVGLVEDEPAVTWKEGNRAGYTVAATTTRTLRIKKGKADA